MKAWMIFPVIGFCVVLYIHKMSIDDLYNLTKQQAKDIAALELALTAKIPAKIKFYTVPGYACDTSEIPGHCTNMWSITQAAYDKDFFKEVGE